MANPGPKLVELVWLDAWCDAAAEVTLDDVHETHKAWTITTIGWLLYDNRDHPDPEKAGVSIANEKTGPKTYRGRSFVPAGMVKSLKPYKSPRNRRPKGGSHPGPANGAGPNQGDSNNSKTS